MGVPSGQHGPGRKGTGGEKRGREGREKGFLSIPPIRLSHPIFPGGAERGTPGKFWLLHGEKDPEGEGRAPCQRSGCLLMPSPGLGHSCQVLGRQARWGPQIIHVPQRFEGKRRRKEEGQLGGVKGREEKGTNKGTEPLKPCPFTRGGVVRVLRFRLTMWI